MRTPIDLIQEEIQQLAGQDTDAEMAFKSIDTDGDGHGDMFLIDRNGDGHIEAVINGLDADGDGVNDLYILYDQDEHIQSIGRIDDEGELTILRETDEDFAPLIANLTELEGITPAAELFSTFDNPYIETNYGPLSDPLEEPTPHLVVTDTSAIEEVYVEDFVTLSDAVDVEELDDPTDEVVNSMIEEEHQDVTITEIGDASGDGSGIFARVDDDADGVWDRKEDLVQTADGWEVDIDNDGLSETVALDEDQDGMIEKVDVTGEGSEVATWELVDSTSRDLVDDDRFELDDEDDLEDTDALDDSSSYDPEEVDDQEI